MADLDGNGRDGIGLDGIGLDGNELGVTAHRRRPDVLTLLVGLLSLGMAVAAFVGQVPDLSGFDARWLLAAGAAVVGVLLLVGSLRGRRGPSEPS